MCNYGHKQTRIRWHAGFVSSANENLPLQLWIQRHKKLLAQTCSNPFTFLLNKTVVLHTYGTITYLDVLTFLTRWSATTLPAAASPWSSRRARAPPPTCSYRGPTWGTRASTGERWGKRCSRLFVLMTVAAALSYRRCVPANTVEASINLHILRGETAGYESIFVVVAAVRIKNCDSVVYVV